MTYGELEPINHNPPESDKAEVRIIRDMYHQADKQYNDLKLALHYLTGYFTTRGAIPVEVLAAVANGQSAQAAINDFFRAEMTKTVYVTKRR